eukprot:gene32842-39712_t
MRVDRDLSPAFAGGLSDPLLLLSVMLRLLGQKKVPSGPASQDLQGNFHEEFFPVSHLRHIAP